MTDSKQTSVKPKKTEEFISVESFLSSAESAYKMSKIQVYAFKNMMKSRGMGVVSGMETYVPYLEKYLGKRGNK